MARIRSLKPEFWDDRKLARAVTRDARMLYMGLWNQADEHGRLNGDPSWIKGRVFPFDDDITVEDVEAMLDELDAAGRLMQYEAEGDPFIYLPNLSKHQRLEPAKVESKIPEPPKIRQSELDAKKSAPRADENEADPDLAQDDPRFFMEHGSGSMGHVGAARGAQTRSRDDLFEAVAEVCGIEAKSLTATGRGSLNASLKQLREVDATPNQVKVRARRFRERYERISLTPPALAKHWAALGDVDPPPTERPTNAMTRLSQNRSTG